MLHVVTWTVVWALGGAPAPAEDAGAPLLVRAATVAPAGTPWEEQLRHMAERFRRLSRGGIRVKAFLGGALGDEDAMLRACERGEVDLVAVTVAPMAAKIPALQVLEFPFLWESSAEVDFVLDTYLYESVANLLARHGFVFYQWAENGWQGFATTFGHVTSPEDLQGRAMRSQTSPLQAQTWRIFRARAVPMTTFDVLPALREGRIEGVSHTAMYLFASGWYRYIKYFTISDHVYQPVIICYSGTFFRRQSAAIQAILLSEAPQDAARGRAALRALQPELHDNLRRAGIDVRRLQRAEHDSFARVARLIQARYLRQADPEGRALLRQIIRGKRAFGQSAAAVSGAGHIKDEPGDTDK